MPNNPSSQRRSYAGPTTCLRCDRGFYSWDRRQNRLCTSCREYINSQPSDDDEYIPPKRRSIPRHD
jgi:hypothetical protein